MSSALDHNEPWAVFLPLKQFATGKSRLGTIPTDLRISLIKAMANDVIDALLPMSDISRITIVGVSHLDLTSNSDSRIDSIPIREPLDINADLQLAIGSEHKIAIFLPDLPSLTSTEIRLALDLATSHQTSFIADQNGFGTTAFFSTIGKVSTRFGLNSAEAHRKDGANELKDPIFKGIKADCDDLADLLSTNKSELGSATRSLMEHHLQN